MDFERSGKSIGLSDGIEKRVTLKRKHRRIINRKAFPSAIKVRQTVFQEWIADRPLLRGRVSIGELHDPRNNVGASLPIVRTDIDVHRTKRIHEVARSYSLFSFLLASSRYRIFAVVPRSIFKLSFVYKLAYFIVGTCFPRNFPTSQHVFAYVGRQDGALAPCDWISASL